MRILTHTAVVCSVALTLSACGSSGGGGGSSTPTSPTTPGASTTTITITASGVSPSAVTVAPGSRVTFQNNLTRTVTPASDPHPSHGSCPPLDQVGSIPAGQSRASGNLNTPGVCRYHDHDSVNPIFNGTITVQ